MHMFSNSAQFFYLAPELIFSPLDLGPTDLWHRVVSAVRRAPLAMYRETGLVDFYETWWAYTLG